MISKQFYAQSCRDVDYSCLELAANSKPSRIWSDGSGQAKLFHFMCRWTCSRCWKMAMLLGTLENQLRRHNIGVILVGSSQYISQATDWRPN